MNAAAAVAVALLITLTITTTTTTTTAVSSANDDVAPMSIWPYKHVHVSNELGGGRVLRVHCSTRKWNGKKDDLGIQFVAAGAEYTWRFKPRFLFGNTKYWCYVAPAEDDVDPVHILFLAYVQLGDPVIVQHDNNVYWAVRPDGVYMRDTSGEIEDLLSYVWMPGK